VARFVFARSAQELRLSPRLPPQEQLFA